MNKDKLKRIELKSDGKNAERFRDMLKTVVNVPKEELKKEEERQKKEKKKD